jgi:hypothetical protein
LIRIEACHTLVLLIGTPQINTKDREIIDVLIERQLVEEEPQVKKYHLCLVFWDKSFKINSLNYYLIREIMDTLDYLGYDSSKELPLVTKIKQDIKKLNSKQHIIKKIRELESELNFEADKRRFIWHEDKKQAGSVKDENVNFRVESAEIFEPRLVNKADAGKSRAQKSSFLSKLVATTSTTMTTIETEENSLMSESSTRQANYDEVNCVDESDPSSSSARQIASAANLDIESFESGSPKRSLSPKKVFFGSPSLANTSSSKFIDTILEEND